MGRLTSRVYGALGRLARRLDLPAAVIKTVLKSENGVHDYYISWAKPKRSGGYRILRNPQEPLRTIQTKIRKQILSRLKVSPIAHGCIKGKSIATNAECHWRSRSLLSIDLTDAFGSASFSGKLEWERYVHSPIPAEFGLRKDELEALSVLMEVRNARDRICIPQGAITSPDIFNYCCRKLDERLAHLAENVGGVVTRYVDNIFFSMPNPEIDKEIRNAIFRIIAENGFTENRAKTRYIRNGNRNGVPLRLLGINIIDGDLYLPPKTIKRYRERLYQAGLEKDRKTYAGIKGVVIQIYGGWPSRLAGVYYKGLAKGGHISVEE